MLCLAGPFESRSATHRESESSTGTAPSPLSAAFHEVRAENGRRVQTNVDGDLALVRARSGEESERVGEACALHMGLSIAVVIDDWDNSTASPTRPCRSHCTQRGRAGASPPTALQADRAFQQDEREASIIFYLASVRATPLQSLENVLPALTPDGKVPEAVSRPADRRGQAVSQK